MKVLHIGEYVNGGVATYLKTLLKDSDKYGVESYLLMSAYKSESQWNIAKDRLFFYKYKRSLFHIFSAMKSIHYYIHKIQPDVIHVHSSWAGLFVRFPYLFKRKKMKIIYTSHGWAFLMDTSFLKKKIYIIIERFLSQVTDKIINISRYEQEQAVKAGFNQDKMIMIYNGVENVKKQMDCATVKMAAEKINLLFVGRIDKTKGLDIFLEAYYEQAFSNIHLYVIGESVLDHIHMESDTKTTYLGWVKNENIDAYYQACDAVIMPSRWEGFGLVAIEAMRNSKPVIVSNRGALPEIVKDKISGYVFNLEDTNQLQDILEKIKKDDLRCMGIKGNEQFIKYFSGEEFCWKTIQLYK